MELKNKNILVTGGNGSQKVREYYKNANSKNKKLLLGEGTKITF